MGKIAFDMYRLYTGQARESREETLNMQHTGRPILVEWAIQKDYQDGTQSVSKGHNLVVNDGRTRILSLAFVPSASTGLGGFYWLGVGASATPATVTDTRLTYELIGNPTRKFLTNTNGITPTTGNIQLETVTVSGCTFYEKLVLQAIYSTTDGNNSNTFNEYGIFTTATLPGSPTSTSGTMFNHYIDPSPATKSALNTVTAVVTIRI